MLERRQEAVSEIVQQGRAEVWNTDPDRVDLKDWRPKTNES